MSVLYDSWSTEYKKPFGALKTSEECEITLKIPFDVKYDSEPVLVIFAEGKDEVDYKLSFIENVNNTSVYKTKLSLSQRGIYYYYFKMTSDGYTFFIKKNSCHLGTFDEGGMFQLTVYSKDYKTPKFLKGGIMYQIFPDRFCNSGTPKDNIPYGRVLREDWGGTPFYMPDEKGHYWNNDYFGGDFKGIISKLDYLKDLGVTCIYLNPIFESHENHRYNTANYMNADPQLGTNDDFKELCKSAKKKGISIILDGVFSHTGADSIYFNKFNRYNSKGAYNSKDSDYYNWYTFTEHPDKYEAWWGIDTLPNVRETNPNYMEYIFGENGVINYWLSLGASGFRLDVADELPDEFLIRLRECIKKFGDDKLIIGEVWEDASNKESYGIKRTYLLGSQLDSVMNYPFRNAILNYIKSNNGEKFYTDIMTIIENYPKESIDCLMNFVSTHDIERAINFFGSNDFSDKPKEWLAHRYLNDNEYNYGKNLLKQAMVLQFFLPGVPSIYYGDEAGLQGYKDPFNRRCYPWGNEDAELIFFTKKLGEIRNNCISLKEGNLKFIQCDDNIVSFVRYNDSFNFGVIIYLNRSNSPKSINIDDIGFNIDNVICHHGEISNGIIHTQPNDYSVIEFSYK